MVGDAGEAVETTVGAGAEAVAALAREGAEAEARASAATWDALGRASEAAAAAFERAGVEGRDVDVVKTLTEALREGFRALPEVDRTMFAESAETLLRSLPSEAEDLRGRRREGRARR